MIDRQQDAIRYVGQTRTESTKHYGYAALMICVTGNPDRKRNATRVRKDEKSTTNIKNTIEYTQHYDNVVLFYVYRRTMAATLQDLRDITYAILREEEDVSAYPLVFVDQLLNAAQRKICLGRVINPLNRDEVIKGQLPFANATKMYTSIASTSITVDTVVSGTTVTVSDTTNYATTGAIEFAGSVRTYTSKTPTTFVGISPAIDIVYKAGTVVSPAYILPTDYASPLGVAYNNVYELEPKLYDDILESMKSYKNATYTPNRNNTYPYNHNNAIPPFYSIYDGKYLLVYNIDKSGDMIRLRYMKKPPVMVASTDETMIDDETDAKGTVPYLAVGELLYNRGEESRGAELIMLGMAQVRTMYRAANNTTYQDPSGKQYRSGKGGRRLNV